MTPKIGRNDPCPCGSGRKYKKCCGRERPAPDFSFPDEESGNLPRVDINRLRRMLGLLPK